MSTLKPGDRVGAIQEIGLESVKFFGYGIYEGEYNLPPHVYYALDDNDEDFNQLSPRIRLDNSKELFGVECIWGSEEAVKKEIGDRRVITIDIYDYRKNIMREKAKGLDTRGISILALKIGISWCDTMLLGQQALSDIMEKKMSAEILSLSSIIMLAGSMLSHVFKVKNMSSGSQEAKDLFITVIRELEEVVNKNYKELLDDPPEINLSLYDDDQTKFPFGDSND